MVRLRFYKILLPIVLVVFLVLLVRALDPPAGSHTAFEGPSRTNNALQGVALKEFDGAELVYDLSAGSVEEHDGRFDLDEIRRLEYFRERGLPLIFSAGRGEITGKKGERVLRFEKSVAFEDPDKQLTLRIHSLEVDQAAQEARTTDRVELSGSTLSGSAQGLVYSLSGLPGRLSDLELTDAAGTRLTARRALLHDGLRDIELFDSVRISRGEERLGAARMRVYRRADDSLQRVEALASVTARLLLPSGEPLVLDSDTLNVDFDGQAEPLTFEATAARVHGGAHRLKAETLRARRVGAAGHEWRVVSDGDVLLESELEGGTSTLRAETSVALLDAGFGLIEATASGDVRFDADQTHAEADWAGYFATREEIRLVGSEKRKARLARLDTRVAAERITTDPRGVRLVAEEQVEATLLPTGGAGRGRTGLFLGDSAVHFLASRLESGESASVLTFSGEVRGWQGDRTLSADSLTLDQGSRSMLARDHVAARIPRGAGGVGTAESDFVQIRADALSYSDITRVAEFSGDVRVQLVEGWVESATMQVKVSDADGAIERIEAEGGVRLEFHEASDGGAPRLMTGKADRLKYDPRAATVWLMGDNAPATVRRVGVDQGTTSGRVLRYQLNDGSIEVDSGASGPARIRTSER